MILTPDRAEIRALLELLLASGADWELVRRIVLHWTAGAHRANAIDLRHYHYLVEGDGTIQEGDHALTQNLRQIRAGDAYAAHTGGMNSWAMGVSYCGMAGAEERGTFGHHPLTDVQVHRGLLLVAVASHLADRDPGDVDWLHTHGEAWRVHGVKGQTNHWKWDPERLPWMADRSRDEVSAWLRETASGYLELVRGALEEPTQPVGPLRDRAEPNLRDLAAPRLRLMPLPAPARAISLLRRTS